MSSRFLVFSVVVAGLVAVASAAAAAPSLTLAPPTVRAGHVTVIRGNAGDCPVGDAVFVISHAFPRAHEFAGVPAAVAKVRAGGVFQVTTRIPAVRKPGRYTVTARCGGGNLGILRHLTVR
jgi:hypothetical protein